MACRDYRQSLLHPAEDLLAGMLQQPLVAPPRPVVPPPVMVSRPTPVRPAGPSNRMRAVVLAAAALFAVVLALVVVPAAIAVFRIGQNVQAYQLATPPAVATPVMALAPVAPIVSTPLPATPSPLPTVQPATAQAMTSATGLPPQPSATTAARTVPTQTITPVPLEAILAINGSTLPQPRARNQSPLTPQSPTNTGGAINILLMGIDRRPGEGNATRADTVMVARIDPVNQRVAMLSLPRDLIVPIAGVGYARINAANVYGEGTPGGGIALTRQTVEDLLGISIDYVAQVDFQGFIGVVDSLGGIDINVPTEIYDNAYPTMDYGYTIAHFLPGPQHMDGARALMYARTRHADSDFARIRRQQAVLVAVLQQVRSQNMLQQLQSIADITGALRGYVQTDLPESQMISMAWSLRSLSPDQVERYSLDENAVQIGVLADDPYAQFPLPGAVETLADQFINGP